MTTLDTEREKPNRHPLIYLDPHVPRIVTSKETAQALFSCIAKFTSY